MSETGADGRDRASLGGRFVRPIPLLVNESVIEEFVANYSQSSFRAVGGKLIVTNRRVVFTPHHLDAATAGRTVSIPLVEIAAVGVQERGGNVLSGSLRKRLRIETHSGSTKLFVVNGRRHVIAVIDEARRATHVDESCPPEANPSADSAQDPSGQPQDDRENGRADESGQEAEPEREHE